MTHQHAPTDPERTGLVEWLRSRSLLAQVALAGGVAIVALFGLTPTAVAVADRAFSINLASALPGPLQHIAGVLGDPAVDQQHEASAASTPHASGPEASPPVPHPTPSSAPGPVDGPTLIPAPVTSSPASPGDGDASTPSRTSSAVSPTSQPGPVRIGIDPQSATFTVAGFAPGDTAAATVVVSNHSDYAVRYALRVGAKGALGSHLGFAARLLGAGPCAASDFGPASASLTSAGGGFVPLAGAGFDIDAPDVPALAPGASQSLCVAVDLDPSVGNEAQGESGSMRLHVTAEQQP